MKLKLKDFRPILIKIKNKLHSISLNEKNTELADKNKFEEQKIKNDQAEEFMIKKRCKHLYKQIKDLSMSNGCCSYCIPPTPQVRGVYKPENFVKFFPKVYPLTPCNYFCENGFLKIVQLMNI